jgi:hypothetical protein
MSVSPRVELVHLDLRLLLKRHVEAHGDAWSRRWSSEICRLAPLETVPMARQTTGDSGDDGLLAGRAAAKAADSSVQKGSFGTGRQASARCWGE